MLFRSQHAHDQLVAELWAARTPDAGLKSIDEMVIMASIIDSETKNPKEQFNVASVLANRIKHGMGLQSDPTVIYGIGDRFDGNLRRDDLTTDTPWNTYVRRGLPPTPIALPGRQALLATARPAASQALYFVAKGDGSSAFSDNLTDHNRAVNQYQRGGSR